MAHYQFEAIHPFEDSDGRIGHVLTSLILSDKGLLTSPKLISEPIYHSKQKRLLSRIIKCH
ncbi:Fic family protein [Snodgrassella gandavensis]|uniref:Fic family protein n=1 Tax=Snodgrassella gandavensis TaxID=2946698 RepID=UPI001EF4D54B|nr:Fic family protein [Snodgrassella gandavensis]